MLITQPFSIGFILIILIAISICDDSEEKKNKKDKKEEKDAEKEEKVEVTEYDENDDYDAQISDADILKMFAPQTEKPKKTTEKPKTTKGNTGEGGGGEEEGAVEEGAGEPKGLLGWVLGGGGSKGETTEKPKDTSGSTEGEGAGEPGGLFGSGFGQYLNGGGFMGEIGVTKAVEVVVTTSASTTGHEEEDDGNKGGVGKQGDNWFSDIIKDDGNTSKPGKDDEVRCDGYGRPLDIWDRLLMFASFPIVFGFMALKCASYK